MRAPLITVITAIRNGEPYLEETIRSIQAQSVEDWEYIIVDDGSTDNTVALVERAIAKDSRLRLVRREESGGPYIAANDALPLSRGRYIMRTDGDDLQPPDRFARQLDFLASNPHFKACVTYWQAFNENGLIPGSVATVPSPRPFKWYLLLRGASIHSSLCIEKSALVAAGGYRALPLSQDHRLWCELTRREWLGVMPEVLSHVRFHTNRSTNRRGALQNQLAQDVVRDHWLALTGRPCSQDEIEGLWAVGYSLPADLKKGLMMLERWDQFWQQDPALDAEDRKELKSLSRLRRRKLLRANLRRQPAATVLAALGFGLSQPKELVAIP